MKTHRLALRVTLNSALMILGVYAVMQIVTYIRDNILLGLSGFASLPAMLFGFLGDNVVPPLLVFSIILYLLALPIQRTQVRLEAGEDLGPEELEATRKRLLRFSPVVLVLNLLGFVLGYILFEVFSGHATEYSSSTSWSSSRPT